MPSGLSSTDGDAASALRTGPAPTRKRRPPEPNFIFVGGSGHCGAGLLAAMLGAHSRIYSIAVDTRCFLRDIPDDKRRKRLSLAARGRDKADVDYVCEKTPGHIRVFDAILRLYPEAKLLATVRDPRDVVTSCKRQGQETGVAIRKWTTACLRLADWQKAGLPLHVVRFERLVTDPPAALAEVCGFLGLTYEEAMLDYWRNPRLWYGVEDSLKPDAAAGDEGRRAWTGGPRHEPVMGDRIGCWQDGLSAAELDEIAEALFPLAAGHGYALPRPRPKWLRRETYRRLAARLRSRGRLAAGNAA